MKKNKTGYNAFRGLLIIFLSAAVIFSISLISDYIGGDSITADDLISATSPTAEAISEDNYPPYVSTAVSSTNIVLMDAQSGNYICEKNSSTEVAPASLVKMMTAIVALESGHDLSGTYTFKDSTIAYLTEQNASCAGFAAGETVTGYDLLNGMMLPSGGDGAIGLAEFSYGDVETFVAQMNKKAEELGLRHTHFMNVTGLDEDGQYSSASDMAEILKYGIKNEKFLTLITTPSYTTSVTATHPYGIVLESLVHTGITNNNIETPHILGGKTGFTDAARLCLASLSEYEDRQYILVVMGAGQGDKLPQYNFIDTQTIYNEFVVNKK